MIFSLLTSYRSQDVSVEVGNMLMIESSIFLQESKDRQSAPKTLNVCYIQWIAVCIYRTRRISEKKVSSFHIQIVLEF